MLKNENGNELEKKKQNKSTVACFSWNILVFKKHHGTGWRWREELLETVPWHVASASASASDRDIGNSGNLGKLKLLDIYLFVDTNFWHPD